MRSSHMLLCASLLVVGVVLFAGGLGAFTFVPPRGVHADDDGKRPE